MIEEINNRLYFMPGVGNVCDVKSYNCRKAVDTNTSIKVICKELNETMILTPEDIKTKIVKISKKEFNSKYIKDQKYKIISYKWNPIK